MEIVYLIDTNVLIDYTSKKFSESTDRKLDAIFNDEFNYSIISKIEVLGYAKATMEDTDYLYSFFNAGKQFDVNDLIADQVILLRRSLTKNNLPDTIIAATAMVNNYTLLTNNTKHFRNIPGLKFDNSWDWK